MALAYEIDDDVDALPVCDVLHFGREVLRLVVCDVRSAVGHGQQGVELVLGGGGGGDGVAAKPALR